MSQLVRAIMAKDTGKRVVISDSFSPCFKDVFSCKEEFHQAHFADVATVYHIGVELASEVVVSDLQLLKDVSGNALEQAVLRTKQHIIQAVFGEFREDFYQIQQAIYDRDFAKSRELLTNFERKMFSVE